MALPKKTYPQQKSVSFTMVGDWDRVEASLKALGPGIAASAMYGQQNAAEKFVKNLKSNIRSNRFNNPYPVRGNSSGVPLIDTETYINNIKAFRSGGRYFAGIKRGVKNHKGTKELSRVAAFLEGGTRKMPPRPVWKPTYDEMGGALGIKAIIMAPINAKIATVLGTKNFKLSSKILNHRRAK